MKDEEGARKALESAVAVSTVDHVDLDRYAGDWFEIARFPNRFQRRCSGYVRARYRRRPDGLIDVLNSCRARDRIIEAHGIARVVDLHSCAKLKVRFAPSVLSFLPFVWGDYWIIGLAEDYSWSLVGTPDRKYLWILSRTSTLDRERIEAARSVATKNGFPIERLVPTPSGDS